MPQEQRIQIESTILGWLCKGKFVSTVIKISLALSLIFGLSSAPLAVSAANPPDGKPDLSVTVAPPDTDTVVPTAVAPSNIEPARAAGTAPTNSSAPANSSAPVNTASVAPASPVESADSKLAIQISKYDTLRTKQLAASAQEEERLMPIAGMQKQIVQLESLFGRANANVVMLYHLLARRYQVQAYVTGKFADAERLYRWLTDTPPTQKGFDELFYGSAYLAMADGYRMTRRYDLALTTYERSIPIFSRGKKAALNVIADYKTFGESGRDQIARTSSQSKVTTLMANNKAFIDAMEKSIGNERYVARPVADAYFGMAVCYLNRKDMARAREYFDKARANGMQIIDISKVKAAGKKTPVKGSIKGKAKPG